MELSRLVDGEQKNSTQYPLFSADADALAEFRRLLREDTTIQEGALYAVKGNRFLTESTPA